MQKITFDFGTQPWDGVLGQTLEADGVGNYPGWQDSLTGTSFSIVLGRMWIELASGSSSNRLLMLDPLSPDPNYPNNNRTIMRIRFTNPQNFVRLWLNNHVLYDDVKVEFYIYPSYGTGGRPGQDTLVRRISTGSVGEILYSDICRPFTEIWITINGLNSNLDYVEFDKVKSDSWFQNFICWIRNRFYQKGNRTPHLEALN